MDEQARASKLVSERARRPRRGGAKAMKRLAPGFFTHVKLAHRVARAADARLLPRELLQHARRKGQSGGGRAGAAVGRVARAGAEAAAGVRPACPLTGRRSAPSRC